MHAMSPVGFVLAHSYSWDDHLETAPFVRTTIGRWCLHLKYCSHRKIFRLSWIRTRRCPRSRHLCHHRYGFRCRRSLHSAFASHRLAIAISADSLAIAFFQRVTTRRTTLCCHFPRYGVPIPTGVSTGVPLDEGSSATYLRYATAMLFFGGALLMN